MSATIRLNSINVRWITAIDGDGYFDSPVILPVSSQVLFYVILYVAITEVSFL